MVRPHGQKGRELSQCGHFVDSEGREVNFSRFLCGRLYGRPLTFKRERIPPNCDASVSFLWQEDKDGTKRTNILYNYSRRYILILLNSSFTLNILFSCVICQAISVSGMLVIISPCNTL